MIGKSVRIRGVVTAGTGTFSSEDNDIFVQDATGGINVFKGSSTTPYVSVGDSVEATGMVDTYFGLTRLTSPALKVIAPGAGAPETTLVTTADIGSGGENYEGRLVQAKGCTIVAGAWPSVGADGTVTLNDGSGDCALFIDRDTDIDGTARPDSTIDVVGIVTQYDPALPYLSGYRLMPRSTADVMTAGGTPDSLGGSGLVSRVLPNPTENTVTIVFGRKADGIEKRITIYDVSGGKVREVVVAADGASWDWDARDAGGRDLPSGIYLALVKTTHGKAAVKIVLVR